MRYEPVGALHPHSPQITAFTTFDELPEGDREFRTWGSGIRFNAQECTTSYSLAYCQDGVTPSKTLDDQGGKLQNFEPFRVYATATCESVLETEDPEFVQLTRDKLDASISWQVARQLWKGSLNANNASLQSVGQIVPVGGTGSLAYTMGALIQYYTDVAKQGGFIIHMPPVLLTLATQLGFAKLDGDHYVGPYNQPIAGLQGYPGLATSDATSTATWNNTAFGPAKDANGAAHNQGGAVGVAPNGQANVTTAWMFISGRVEWGLRRPYRVLPDSFSGRNAQPRTNRYTVFADTDAIVRFDPCAVYGALVTLP